MMTEALSATQLVLREILFSNDVRVATKYLSEKLVVRATRVVYRRVNDSRGPISICLHVGRPNYLERKFVKDCRKGKVSFPVREAQLKMRKAKKR